MAIKTLEIKTPNESSNNSVFEHVLIAKVAEIKSLTEGFYNIEKFENGSAWGVILRGGESDEKTKRAFLDLKEEFSDLNYNVIFKFINYKFKDYIKENFIF